MAWTDPTQRTTGDLITQSIYNADIIDNLAYLIAAIEPDTLTNQSGGSLSAGAVVVADTANDTSFTTTTDADDEDILGVVMETIGIAAAGRVARIGVVTVNVQGNVTRGNYLSTSTTAGRAKDAGTTKTAATFARALTAYAGGGAGTVTAVIMVAENSSAGVAANVVAYTSAGSAPTGWAELTAGRGRMIVGLPSGGTNAGTVGTALTNLQDKTHSHGTPQTDVQSGTGASGLATESTSSEALSNFLAYIQYMTISKS